MNFDKLILFTLDWSKTISWYYIYTKAPLNFEIFHAYFNDTKISFQLNNSLKNKQLNKNEIRELYQE